MTVGLTERSRLSFLGWLATVAMSLAFFPALADKSYVARGAFVAGCVVGAGVLLRRLRAPHLVTLGAQLLLLAELLLIGYAGHTAYVVVPTSETFAHLREILTSGIDVAQEFPAPAPADPGLTLMVVFFIALMAIAVDFFINIGRVPLAGLPLLALYTVPVAALPDGVPILGFLPGAMGYIALLTVDERDRLSHWGRRVARSVAPVQATSMDTSGLAATGRRISFAALAIAVVIPIFIPAFTGSLLDAGRGSGRGSGIGGDAILSFDDPMVSLAHNLKRDGKVDLLVVDSDVSPQYLRLVVLEVPGPNAWTARSLDLTDTLSLSTILPPPTGLDDNVARHPRTMTITPTKNFPSNSAWLPVPYNAKFIAAPSVWAYVPDDQTVTGRTSIAAASLTDYTINYANIRPSARQLESLAAPPQNIVDRYGTVPQDIPFEVGNTARVVTAGATSNYERALLLQSFFRDRSQFTYDLDVSYGYGYQAMVQFLNDRKGFCQHFAATMAMMARTLGIPSRVVVGFLQPDRFNGAGDAVISSHQMHAWPELYFTGVGWVRFEPTPGVGAPLPQWAPPTTQSANPTEVPTSLGPTASTDVRDRNTGASTSADAGSGSGGSGGNPVAPSKWWLVPLALLLLLLAPAALRAGVRRTRMTRPVDGGVAAESAWTELRDHIRDLRLPWTGSMTPRARERSVAPLLRGDDGGLAALHRLAISVERARYARSLLPDAAPASDAREVMSVISRQVDRSQRAKAILWPTSLMPDLRIGWGKLVGRFSSRRGGGASDLPSGS